MTKQSNHNSDMVNKNKGTSGTNKTYDKNQGNRGWQMNPENPVNKGKK
ncbi:alpha-amylase [Photobacterium minamisatsumaniensis]